MFLHLQGAMNLLKSQLHSLHVLKDAKPQPRRAELASAKDELNKAFVECAINTPNGNRMLPNDDKSKLKYYRNCLRALVYSEISWRINVNI